jgi:hypothetical protein
MATIEGWFFSTHAFQAAIPSFCLASRSASGRAFHAVIRGFVLLARNTVGPVGGAEFSRRNLSVLINGSFCAE